jgi:hypothetical protein
VTRRHPTGAPEFFCLPTSKGPNLPTTRLWDGPSTIDVREGVRRLQQEVLGRDGLATVCVGFVRNVVPNPDVGYVYPSPWAHVPVMLLDQPADPIVTGEWFRVPRGRRLLSDRHWWRIVEHHLCGVPTTTGDADR